MAPLDHSKCQYSTGIDDSLTAGQGELDANGFWEIPCPECRETMRRKIVDAGLDRLDRIASEKGEGSEFFSEMATQCAALSKL